jgi:hypothetical protein
VSAPAGQTQAPAREEGLRVKANGGYRRVAVEVLPIKGSEGGDQAEDRGDFLVLFEEAAAPVGRTPRAARVPLGRRTRPTAEDGDAARLERWPDKSVTFPIWWTASSTWSGWCPDRCS